MGGEAGIRKRLVSVALMLLLIATTIVGLHHPEENRVDLCTCGHHLEEEHTCGHHLEEEHTCGHHLEEEHTCGHQLEEEHTCGHHHDASDGDGDDPLKNRWVAAYTDERGALHEHPVIFRTASGLAYLTAFNIPTAIDVRYMDRGVLFLYQQGCGLCEDAHTQFAAAVEAISNRWPAANRSSRVLFGQVDVSPSDSDDDEESALEAIRQRFGHRESAGNESRVVKDYPTVVLLDYVGTPRTELRVQGLSGSLTPHRLAALMQLEGASPSDDGAAGGGEGTSPFVFDDGILVC